MENGCNLFALQHHPEHVQHDTELHSTLHVVHTLILSYKPQVFVHEADGFFSECWLGFDAPFD
jgi:hypothetical protein